MVTVKLKQIDADEWFLPTSKGVQSGTVILTKKQIREVLDFEDAYDEFMGWTKRKYHIFCHGRTKTDNNKVNGNANSNHINLLARDTYFEGTEWTKERFIKYAKKWKEISSKYGFVGEIGYYPQYSWNKYNCKGMIHIGVQHYSKTFSHWVTVDGVQKNMVYDI